VLYCDQPQFPEWPEKKVGKMVKSLLSVGAFVSLGVSNPVSALVIGIDELVVIKNRSSVFDDDFGNSAPPAVGPNGQNT
jgi:hypothetical protein